MHRLRQFTFWKDISQPQLRAAGCLCIDPTSSLLESAPGITSAWVVRATWGFVALGLLVRLVRFLVVYPLWPDEAFVAANFLERGYLDLLGNLAYGQVCPFLFLWIELTVVRLLGFAEWSLRLFPLLCGLASVLLFRHLAARLLSGVPLVLSVGIFATAFAPIRHGAEVKPYSSDLLAALILLTLAVEWWRVPDRARMWWNLSAIVPIALALSYTSIFVATGLSLTLAPVVFRQSRKPVKWAYTLYNLVFSGSFLVIYLAATSSQSSAVLAGYRSGYWRDSFPPWGQPWRIPGWLISMHTGNMLAYPIGGSNGASTVTFAAVVVGTLAFWRRGQRTAVGLLISPILMGLAASALGRYPYGGSARIMQYVAPSICILSGLGFSVLLTQALPPGSRQRGMRVAAVALALLGIYFAVSDLVRPYRTFEDWENRRFARWFWSDYGREADLLCARCDLAVLSHTKDWHTGMSAVYLCHHEIYARRSVGTGRRLQFSTDKPFRVVFFDRIPQGVHALDRWLTEISKSHQIGKRSEFVVNSRGPVGDRSRYLVVEFTPRNAGNQVARALDERTILSK